MQFSAVVNKSIVKAEQFFFFTNDLKRKKNRKMFVIKKKISARSDLLLNISLTRGQSLK